MTTQPGYIVTITAFLPADPHDTERMTVAMEELAVIKTTIAAQTDLTEIIVAHRFVARHKTVRSGA